MREENATTAEEEERATSLLLHLNTLEGSIPKKPTAAEAAEAAAVASVEMLV